MHCQRRAVLGSCLCFPGHVQSQQGNCRHAFLVAITGSTHLSRGSALWRLAADYIGGAFTCHRRRLRLHGPLVVAAHTCTPLLEQGQGVCVCAHHSRGFPRAAGLPTRYPNAHVCNQQTMVSPFRIEIQLGKNYCACGSTSRAGNLANKIINRLDN